MELPFFFFLFFHFLAWCSIVERVCIFKAFDANFKFFPLEQLYQVMSDIEVLTRLVERRTTRLYVFRMKC